MVVHNFDEQLAYSRGFEDAPWWPEVYRDAFGDGFTMQTMRNDGWAQRAGIDRVLVLQDGRRVTVDEKVRAKDWGDILLEMWSDYERRARGWVCKDSDADFIAYAIAPTGVCYLLPVLLLRRAWRQHHTEWCLTYGTRKAVNRSGSRSWTTVSVPVPSVVLLDALRHAIVVRFTPTPLATNGHGDLVKLSADLFDAAGMPLEGGR